MKIDLHCHSIYSPDSFLEPSMIVKQAVRGGLDGVCLTEHYSVGVSIFAEKIKLPENFYLFRGVEISTNRGHILVYGLIDDSWNKWSKNQNLDIDEVIFSVHALGGVCFAAHPFRDNNSIGNAIFDQSNLDGIETHNGHDKTEDNVNRQRMARLKRMTSVGGSDAHFIEEIGRAFTVFEIPVRNASELAEQIKLGNCYGSF